LQEAELQKERLITDVNNLYITIRCLDTQESDKQLEINRQLFYEGKFREANVLLNVADLKKQKEDNLLHFEQLSKELENNAAKYMPKARVTLTDLTDTNSNRLLRRSYR